MARHRHKNSLKLKETQNCSAHKLIYSSLSKILNSSRIEFFMTLDGVINLLNNVIKSCILDVFAISIMYLTYLYKYSVGTIIYRFGQY